MFRGRQPKIVIVGAASSSFANLLAELAGSTVLDGAEIALVDIDADGLDMMTRLGRRMVGEWARKTTVTGTTDRPAALEGADFVITTIAVGGVKTWRQDQQIPAKHGFLGGAVDTTGPGGLMRGLRLIPPMIDICRDVERICPDAWVINYSNPMTAICRTINKVTGVKIAGLCTAGFLPKQVARYLDIEPADRVEVISAGVNHCVWALKVLVDGEDITDKWSVKMLELLDNNARRGSAELLEVHGYWPMPGTGHVAEFLPYFYGPERDGRSKKLYIFRGRHDMDERAEKERAQRESLIAQADGKKPLGYESSESGSESIRMLTSIWNNGRTRHYANIPNRGCVTNLPGEAVLEIPVIADQAGIRGLQIGPMPGNLVGLVQARCAYFELLADAAIDKSRRLALQCLLADTNTTSIRRARACLEEMFEVQAEYLPGFQ